MSKVKAKYPFPMTVHAIGFCQGCDEQFDLFGGDDGRKEMNRHILDTGHEVIAEYGSTNTYYRKGDSI